MSPPSFNAQMLLLIPAAALAFRNVRGGRGDRRGALRLALVHLVLQHLSFIFVTNHVAGAGEIRLYQLSLGMILINSLVAYLLYLALEPYLRRYWPQILVAWSRLFAGRGRDPLVGREVLVGIALGVVWFVGNSIAYWVGGSLSTFSSLDQVLSFRRVANLLMRSLGTALMVPFALGLVVLLLRVVLRRTWLAAVVFVAVMALLGQGPPPWSAVGAASFALFGLMLMIAMTQFGLLAVSVVWLMWLLLSLTPTTLDMSAWYAGVSIAMPVAIAGMAAYGCYLAMGSRLAPIPIAMSPLDRR